MVAGNAKRIVVIRDISSNIIEEAILILKSEPGAGGGDIMPKPGDDKRKRDNDFLVKEAETIINNYIRENHIQIAQNRKGRDRRYGSTLLSNTVINIMLLGGIAILIYIVCMLM